jgi:hypothetical protein
MFPRGGGPICRRQLVAGRMFPRGWLDSDPTVQKGVMIKISDLRKINKE